MVEKFGVMYNEFVMVEVQTKEADSPENSTEKKEVPEKDVFSWRAPERPFKRRDRQFWITIVAIASIFGLILFLAEGVMPVILIISLIFLFYVLSTVEPEETIYTVTNKGIKISEKLTDWQVLTRFWFTKRLDSDLLVFDMNVVPGRLELVVHSKDKDKIRDILTSYMKEEEAQPSNIDRTASWFSRFLPKG